MTEETKDQTAWIDRINWTTRKSRLAKRICIFFKTNRKEDLSFGQILDKYCEKGMGRIKVLDMFRKMTNNKIKMSQSALWEAWRAEYAQGECKFSFNAQWTGNPHHGNKGLTWSSKKGVRDKEIIKDQTVLFKCKECNHKYKKKTNITVEPYLFVGLEVSKCPKCQKFGTLKAKFAIKTKDENHPRKVYQKEVINGEEEFVEVERWKKSSEKKETTHGCTN